MPGNECVTVSSTGKVLVAGGYLVLDNPNVGLTISSSSRFYASVCALAPSSDSTSSAPSNVPPSALKIVVVSPQFHSRFDYIYDASNNGLESSSSDSNEFVEKCLSLVLSFCNRFLGPQVFLSKIQETKAMGGEGKGELWIKLRAHNDFYSQVKELQSRGLPLLSSSLETLPSFLPCPIDETTGKVSVAKTGMGSSAALTTSLVGALLEWFGVVSLSSNRDEIQSSQNKKIIHNLAQLAHAIAQGKIGSGFDVSAAVYGTQLYVRFSASGFSKCMEPNPSSDIVYESVMNDALWGQTMTPFSLPPCFDIVMGDVCGGSSSTSMAREVLKWKAENPEAPTLWKTLGETNLLVYNAFVALNTLATRDSSLFNNVLKSLAEKRASEWPSAYSGNNGGNSNGEGQIVEALLTLKAHFKKARSLLKSMGDGAGVGIEPDNQTALADATEALEGVLCAGVPGAGGNDAVFAIVISETARQRVEAMWSVWNGNGSSSGDNTSDSVVCPLMLRAESGASHTSDEKRPNIGVRVETEITWD